MSTVTRAVVTVERTSQSAVFRGPARVVHPAIRRTGAASQYDHSRRAWKVPLARLDDVSAAIELAGHTVDEAGPR